MKLPILAFLFTFAAFGSALAADSNISVEHAWARPTATSVANGAAYLTIKNTGEADDTLTGAETSAAAKAELHESSMEGGVMKMRPLGDVTVPAGGSVEFKPGGKHIMLLGLKAPLMAGQSFTLTLHFKNAGAQTVNVDVADKAPAASMGGMGGMPGMNMH